jgi:hypothetical protein
LLHNQSKEATHTQLHRVAQLHLTTAPQKEHNNSTRREHPKDRENKSKKERAKKRGHTHHTYTPLHIKTHNIT